MSDALDRYSRQRRLAEVGDAGQARIERAQAEVLGADGALTEVSYLARAGVGSVTVIPDVESTPFLHASWFRYDATRTFGAGAWRALATLRGALGVDTP
jgi:hypothetical protein